MALTHFTRRTFPMKKVWSLLILFFWQEIKYHIQSSKESRVCVHLPHVTAKVNSAKYNWDSVARPGILLEESLGERNLIVSILIGDYIWKEMQTARSESGWAWTYTGELFSPGQACVFKVRPSDPAVCPTATEAFSKTKKEQPSKIDLQN